MSLKMPSRLGAFTLPELLVTLTVLALVSAFAAPRLDALLAEQRSQTLISELGIRIESARKQALARGQTLTLCPGLHACGAKDDWIAGALLFIDDDASGEIADERHILRRFPPLAASGEIDWRSFGNRSWIQFGPNGLTPNQSGRLTYCPESRDARYAQQLILNASGRARLAVDADADGIIESSNGTPVSC